MEELIAVFANNARLVQIRAEDRWTIKQLAAITGYSASIVKDWLSGKFEMHERALRLLELETGRCQPKYLNRQGTGRP